VPRRVRWMMGEAGNIHMTRHVLMLCMLKNKYDFTSSINVKSHQSKADEMNGYCNFDDFYFILT
jgi:hypothetical protein